MHPTLKRKLFPVILFAIIALTTLACYTTDLPENFFSNATPTPLPPLRVSSPPAGFLGDYTYQRQYPDGRNESGSLSISAFSKGYRFDWAADNAAESGMALLKDRILGVAIGNKCALTYYQRYDNGTLVGIWMGWDEYPGPETATPYGFWQNDYSGEYGINGLYRDRSVYSGSLNINRVSQVYELFWDMDDSDDFYGVGLVKDNKLVSVYGSDDCKIMLYEIQSNGSLKGTFASTGSQETGSETAQKY